MLTREQLTVLTAVVFWHQRGGLPLRERGSDRLNNEPFMGLLEGNLIGIRRNGREMSRTEAIRHLKTAVAVGDDTVLWFVPTDKGVVIERLMTADQ